MKQAQKWLALALAAVLVLAAFGCKVTDDAASTASADASATAAATEDPNADAVAVEVGNYTITRKEITDAYDEMVYYYQYYGQTVPTEDADVESMQDSIVSSLLSSKVLLWQADVQGLTPLSAEDQAQVQASYDESLADLIDTYRGYAEDDAANDSTIDVETYLYDLIDQDLEYYGWDMDFEGYKTYLMEQLTNDYVTGLVESTFKDSVTVSEDESKAWYSTNLEADTTTYGDTPTQYAADQLAVEKGESSDPVLTVPTGYIRVKVIRVTPEGELDSSYADKIAEMATLEAEYGKLALSGEDTARQAEIQKSYATLTTETDAMLTAYTAAAEAKINEAYAALESGTSFDEVLAAYGDDTDYADYPTIGEKGKLLYRTEADDWADAIREAALNLSEAGSYSAVVMADNVYYIVQYLGDETSGVVSFADAESLCTQNALSEKQDSEWTAQQSTWAASEEIIYHEDVYRDVGKSSD